VDKPEETANKSKKVAKPRPDKRAIRLDDLIPNEKVLGGGRVIFGARSKLAGNPVPPNADNNKPL
jgi:hypothetical protein